MSEREDVEALIEAVQAGTEADWLRAHDDRIRTEALAPVLALADEWERLWLAARAIKDSPITRIVNLDKAAAALRAAAGTPTHDATEEDADE